MADPADTRLSLIVRLKDAGDEVAWTEFLTLYEPIILRLMLRNGLQENDARDVCQLVLAAVAQDVEQWQPDARPASFRRWLYSIARNRIIRFMVKERKRVMAEGGTDGARRIVTSAISPSTLSADVEREYREQMLLLARQQIKAEFKETTWQAFWLTCVEGKTIAAAAVELGTTVGNVYVARSRIIARMREKVRELEGEE